VDVLRRRSGHAETVYDDRGAARGRPAPFAAEGAAPARHRHPGQGGRHLFLLRHVEGLSIEELAGMFRLEKNNVSVRLHRIRHRLQAEMNR
jgi:hypothetical protein